VGKGHHLYVLSHFPGKARLVTVTVCILLSNTSNYSYSIVISRIPVFGAVCDFFLFVYEISLEPLNGFAPDSHGRGAWSLARTSLKGN